MGNATNHVSGLRVFNPKQDTVAVGYYCVRPTQSADYQLGTGIARNGRRDYLPAGFSPSRYFVHQSDAGGQYHAEANLMANLIRDIPLGAAPASSGGPDGVIAIYSSRDVCEAWCEKAFRDFNLAYPDVKVYLYGPDTPRGVEVQ